MAVRACANISVDEKFAAGVNVLPKIREEIRTAFPEIVSLEEEAHVISINMIAKSAFCIKVNAQTIAGGIPRTDGTTYLLEYEGPIQELIFLGTEEVELAYFGVEWSLQKKNHKLVSIASDPAGATLELWNNQGHKLTMTSEGKYEVSIGEAYDIISEATEDYQRDVERVIAVKEKDTYTIILDIPKEYIITFTPTPTDAKVVVNDSAGNVVKPIKKNRYSLKDSTVAGTYSYTATKADYIEVSGTIDAQQDETVSIALKKIQKIEITTPPTKTAYIAGESFDKSGMVVTATYSDSTTETVSGYSVDPSGELSVEDTKITVSYEAGGVTVTADQQITVTEE